MTSPLSVSLFNVDAKRRSQAALASLLRLRYTTFWVSRCMAIEAIPSSRADLSLFPLHSTREDSPPVAPQFAPQFASQKQNRQCWVPRPQYEAAQDFALFLSGYQPFWLR